MRRIRIDWIHVQLFLAASMLLLPLAAVGVHQFRVAEAQPKNNTNEPKPFPRTIPVHNPFPFTDAAPTKTVGRPPTASTAAKNLAPCTASTTGLIGTACAN